MQDLLTELTEFVAVEVAAGSEPIAPTTELLLAGRVDSLGVVRIVDWLERRLDIEIDPADVLLEHFGSIDAMVGYLTGRGALPPIDDTAGQEPAAPGRIDRT